MNRPDAIGRLREGKTWDVLIAGGGVRYSDGRFDDAALAVAFAGAAARHGATVLNHAPVTALLEAGGKVCGDEAILNPPRAYAPAAALWLDPVRLRVSPAVL